MPRPTTMVPDAVQRRLGIRLEEGTCDRMDGWWLHYGHGRGAEWFPSRDEALIALQMYVKKRVRDWSKDLEAMLKLDRWTEASLDDFNDGEGD